MRYTLDEENRMAARPKKTEPLKEQRPGGKVSTSFRLDPETITRIERLSTELHIPKSAVVEISVREKAKKEKVE